MVKKNEVERVRNNKGSETGHLFLTINIVTSEKLTDEQNALLKELKNRRR